MLPIQSPNIILPQRLKEGISKLSNNELIQLEEELNRFKTRRLTLSGFLKEIYQAPLLVGLFSMIPAFAYTKTTGKQFTLSTAMKSAALSGGSILLYKIYTFLKSKASVDLLLALIKDEKIKRGIE